MAKDDKSLPTHYSDGEEVRWFVVLRQKFPYTGLLHQLHTEDPEKALSPTGRRRYPDDEIVYSARLTEGEFNLGLVRLAQLFQRAVKPGPELALKLELQESLP